MGGTTDMARGLLMLSLRPRLILTTDTDMVWDTDVDTTEAISDTPDTLATDLDMAIDTCMARGLLMLNLRPRLILTTDTDIMVSDTDMVSDMDTMVAISDTPDSDTVCTESKQTNSWNLDKNGLLSV